ncbi:MAG TPA: hypothetical protein VKE69_14260 [Planctomycetota bacterium]|nr:hypothetical protein [Planctomycetota bacterium]
MPVRVQIADTLKTPPSTMRASFDPRPLEAKPEDELLAKVASPTPGQEARAYADSFGAALKTRLAPERAAIEKLSFEQRVHFLGRVLGLEMKAATPQWIALVYAKRGLDAFC